jgi:hypothetical protein
MACLLHELGLEPWHMVTQQQQQQQQRQQRQQQQVLQCLSDDKSQSMSQAGGFYRRAFWGS